MKNDYAIVVRYSAEDACYIADIPDLRFCTAHGETPQEALAEVIIAKGLWLETALKYGKPIPEPQSYTAKVA